MSQLTLVSSYDQPLRPLIESALANEMRLLQAAIRQTRQRLHLFEEQYQMMTALFLEKFENDELPETLELAEWIGEYRLFRRLQEKVKALQGISFAN